MIGKYKSAVYYFDNKNGLDNDVILSLDEWLNTWLKNGYIVNQMSPIIKEGNTVGYLYIFMMRCD